MFTDCEAPWASLTKCEGLHNCLPNVNHCPSVFGNKCLLKYKKYGEKLIQAKRLRFFVSFFFKDD